MGLKLNGWQRLGIVISVFWIATVLMLAFYELQTATPDTNSYFVHFVPGKTIEYTTPQASGINQRQGNIDYSKIPTEDLEALKAGNLKKVSTATLKYLQRQLSDKTASSTSKADSGNASSTIIDPWDSSKGKGGSKPDLDSIDPRIVGGGKTASSASKEESGPWNDYARENQSSTSEGYNSDHDSIARFKVRSILWAVSIPLLFIWLIVPLATGMFRWVRAGFRKSDT